MNETFFLTQDSSELDGVYTNLSDAYEACLDLCQAVGEDVEVLLWSRKGDLVELVELGPSF